MREYRFDPNSVPLTPEVIASYDAMLVTANHDAFDYG